jgi:PAS domain S-box-containing protein
MVDSSGPSGGRPLRILLLEDSDIDAELLESHLASGHFDFTIERATNREEFERLLDHHPDVVLADYALPSFDGLSALEISNRVHPDVPFIFVSGVVGEEFATNALQQGAVDYITKRNLRRLRGAVNRAVREARERLHRRKIESDLRATEVGSRIALRAARLGGWDFDPTSGALVWDIRCRAMFGIDPDTPVDYSLFLQSLHPDDRDRIDAAINRSVTHWSHSDFSEQFRIRTPTGQTLWIESIGSSIFENGICRRFVGVVRDITEQKRAELDLIDRTATLQASVEQQAMERYLLWANAQDLLAVIGPEGMVRDVTPSWEHLLGTRTDDVLGQPLSRFIHPDDIAAFETALSSGEPRRSLQFTTRLRHRDGSYRQFSWVASPDDRGIIYASGRDTTQEHAAAERLRAMEDVLRQAQKMEAIGQLTGGIAHDFNNMLAGILGSLDAIGRRLRKERYDDLERFIDAATGAAQRAAGLTQRLLAFSRRQSLDVRPEDVGGIIGSMEDLLRRTLGENVVLETRYEDMLWPAMTDGNQLESAILNLAINARDAMPEGGRLEVSAANVPALPGRPSVEGLEPGDYVRVTVADTGEGMSEETVAKAFDPFFTTKPIGQGTGLGLSMVYGFVTQAGGHVRIVSAPGEGTRIELYFRRAEAAPARPETVLDGARPSAADGEIVLVVEDDAAVRMLILEVLDDLGYAGIEASDATSALPHIESDTRIDLIVSDVGLPGLSGRQLADLARARRPDVPILFVTGYAQGAEHREDYLGEGMDMLGKPFRSDELANRINAMLASGRPAT